MKRIGLSVSIVLFLVVAACGSSRDEEQRAVGAGAPENLAGHSYDEEPQTALGHPETSAQSLEDPSWNDGRWRCDAEPLRGIYFVSVGSHAWMLSDRFPGGYVIPLFLPTGEANDSWDPSLQIIIDFVRDTDAHTHSRLQVDGEFAAHCEDGSLVGVRIVRVLNAIPRRFRRD